MSPSLVAGVEVAVFGAVPGELVADWLSRHLREYVGSAVEEILFRSGRIAAVFGCRLDDGREVAVKVHRSGADLQHLTAAVHAQQYLNRTGYPCPEPLHGPVLRDGRTVVVESLLTQGGPADGTQAEVRQVLAASLAEQIHLLRALPAMPLHAGAPAWVQYEHGPWPTPHDPIFNFSSRPIRFAWLNELAARAAALLATASGPDVIGHADWYDGNIRVHYGAGPHGVIVSATYDWDSLAAREEAVLAGVSAGSHTLGGPANDVAPSTGQVAAFLNDYWHARGKTSTSAERAAAAAAACWVLSYNARCELSLLPDDAEPAVGSALHALQEGGMAYLQLDY